MGKKLAQPTTTKPSNPPIRSIALNRKARFEYLVIDEYEAGIVLMGSEVKSLRQGKVSFQDSYARFMDNELFLVNLNIGEYKEANIQNHEPLRKRKLLLHRRELYKLNSRVQEKGYTLIPLQIYFKDALIKVKMGVCKGKQLFDKRETVKNREMDRDMARYR